MYSDLDLNYNTDPFEIDFQFSSNENDFNKYLDIDNEFELNESCEGYDFSYLNERDYSLNSPLISDELFEFKKFITDVSCRKSWNMKVWSSARTWLTTICNPHDVQVEDFHRFLGGFLLESQILTNAAGDFLQQVGKHAERTRWVPDAFLRGVFHDARTTPVNLNTTHPYLWKMFSIFLTCHWLVMLMNAKDSQENETIIYALQQHKLGTVVKIADHYKWISPMGVLYFDSNFVYHTHKKRLMSHTHILLIKDIVISRFNSLKYLELNIDPVLRNVDIDKMVCFYNIGDTGLMRRGNDWYDCVGLIEPICNLRFVETSQKLRPLIPIDPSFRKHIESKIIEMTEQDPDVSNFFSFLMDQTDLGDLLYLYGSFRHWGHPEIDYKAGLKKLHGQVQLEKIIDLEYANALASDLAFLVLRKEFKRCNKWFVDLSRLDKTHTLYAHVENNTFPSDTEILNMGDTWHLLPLIQCYEVPDVINPSTIYSDKSHSMTKSEVIRHLQSKPGQRIPSLRVLSTYLERPATNWKEFLSKVDQFGLPEDELIIGLKAKEREIKKVGRFFALMSWALREYFVVTEYLIKTHFVPLFGGLTMADDFATVTKKMLDRSHGQGLTDYKNVCYANHIDYEKWNNHQRKESTSPVFRVMGQFLGLPHLIERTHEFFEKSLIYYNNRGDLMMTDGQNVTNAGDDLVCWNGQKGGLEGLRQKGWSILNLLVIRREARVRSTKVSVLAQGDNQVVCTQYEVQKTKSKDELVDNLNRIYANNKFIMDSIMRGTSKLGLIINASETIQGSDYLNYGKVPIWRGNICPLPTKRWSRAACVTNDQLPTMANMMSTVVTNALTVSNFSVTPHASIHAFNYFGNLVLDLINYHNPATRKPMLIQSDEVESFRVGFLFLDPAIGGISGANLNRFLIRSFPDPVTESLTFWKTVSLNSDRGLQKKLAGQMASVSIRSYSTEHFTKLLENPSSLNLRQGISPETTIKDHIKDKLILNCDKLQNHMIREVLHNYECENISLLIFLESIKPRFPRFLSEFKASTFTGITDSLIGLFQNSKTIRKVFKKNFMRDINKIVIQAEMIGIKVLKDIKKRSSLNLDEMCMSSLADLYRLESWGEKIYGATVPHPSEMFSNFCPATPECSVCPYIPHKGYLVTRANCPDGDHLYTMSGPHHPYLGSRTAESTSLLSPWEQESKVPIIDKAKNLRRAIGWFVPPHSNISRAILDNLKALTGVVWSDLNENFSRTGSALHRFGSERQSAGGYNAVSPTGLSRLYTTTDFLHDFQSKNYDFMFQSSILYAQVTCLPSALDNDVEVYHHHLTCSECIREIGDITLSTTLQMEFTDHAKLLDTWKPSGTNWVTEIQSGSTRMIEWDKLHHSVKSVLIGRVQGFVYGLFHLKEQENLDFKKLFPLVLIKKLNPEFCLLGMCDGIIRASVLHILQRSMLYNLRDPIFLLKSAALDLVESLAHCESLQSFVSHPWWTKELNKIPHKTPASFPQNKSDCSYLILNYLRQKLLTLCSQKTPYLSVKKFPLIIFADFNTDDIRVPFGLSQEILPSLKKIQLTSKILTELRSYSKVLTKAYSKGLTKIEALRFTRKIYTLDQEVRHSVKENSHFNEPDLEERLIWRDEYCCVIDSIPVVFSNYETKRPPMKPFNQTQSPLMSGLRLFQFATGAHYKLYAILKKFVKGIRDFACLGDGSGGITALCLRIFELSRGIFNSLVELKETPVYGQEPSPPATLTALGSESSRCINLKEVTMKPNDLSHQKTWDYLLTLKQNHHLDLDLIIVDFETDSRSRSVIEELLWSNVKTLITSKGILIYKTYIRELYEKDTLSHAGSLFATVDIVQTEMTSLYSEEVYLVCSGSLFQPHIVFPNWMTLHPFLETLAPYRSDEVEFNRCLKLREVNLFQGVPPSLRLPENLRLGETLNLLGVPAGMAFKLGDHFSLELDINRVLSLLILTNHFTFLTASKAQSHLKPPSDSISINLLTQLYGFGYFLSWREQDLHRFVYLNRRIQQKTPISIGSPYSSSGWYKIKWSLTEHLGTTKSFYIDKEASKITQLIRALASISWNQYNEHNDIAVDANLKVFHLKSHWRDYTNGSGTLHLLEKQILLEVRNSNDYTPVILGEVATQD